DRERFDKRETQDHQSLNGRLSARIPCDPLSSAGDSLALSRSAESCSQTHADERTQPGQFTAADACGGVGSLREHGRCQQKYGGDRQKHYFTLHFILHGCISLLFKIPSRRWFQSESWGTGGSHLAAYHPNSSDVLGRGWLSPHKSSSVA